MLSWTPKRKGKIYCAPACGRGCTYAEYQKAKSDAEKLAKIMGKGWKVVVWENLGWYSKVTKGIVDIHTPTQPYDKGEYVVYVQSQPQFIEKSKNPKLALQRALKKFDEHIENLQKARKSIG